MESKIKELINILDPNMIYCKHCGRWVNKKMINLPDWHLNIVCDKFECFECFLKDREKRKGINKWQKKLHQVNHTHQLSHLIQ